MIRAKISGIGSYLPEKILTNEELEKMVDTSDEWITTRTGIKERHIAKENETTVDIAEKASERAIEDANINPEDIDAILFATITPDMIFPSCACLLQDRLQTSNCMAMDFAAACSGFIYGLHIANCLIKTSEAKNVLLVASEKLSSIVDYTDRNTCVLFGDGAGAVIISKTEEDRGILSTYIGSDGSKAELLKKEGGATRLPFNKMSPFDYKKQYLYMDGKAIFKSAVQRMTESLSFALNKANLTFNDLDMIIPHQANLRIIEMVREYGKLKENQVFVNLHKTGNTSAASIPIALDEAIKSGKLKKDNVVGLTAFGGGLTFGSAIIKI
ncbi:MAG TPA: beta-ketoacyl-ACP synthase III [Spirochaetota bacterium]|nr:beta-ketoacyl-ACP synthase III [Spirochaetota bacterium]HOL56904.1 beta-ketoacyl-ACP synthase III [Spirochaetota bacterium]HPP04321.1 beta-ketoacyl-ACP synthase III [Spirochaetota bacterium]